MKLATKVKRMHKGAEQLREKYQRLTGDLNARALEEYAPPPPAVAPAIEMKTQLLQINGVAPLTAKNYHNSSYLDLMRKLK